MLSSLVLLPTAIALLAFPSLLIAETLTFNDVSPGLWELPQANPRYGKSHPSVTLEVIETIKPPEATPRPLLRITGERRGFRHIQDLSPPLFNGIIRYDLQVISGSLLFMAFESCREPTLMNRGIRLAFNHRGEIVSYTGEPGAFQSLVHGRYSYGVWYRVEIHPTLSQSGGGSYRITVTDLESGDPLPLHQAEEIPVNHDVIGLSGFDVDLTRPQSESLIDAITFTPTDTP